MGQPPLVVVETATGTHLGSNSSGIEPQDVRVDEYPGRTREEAKGFVLTTVKDDHNPLVGSGSTSCPRIAQPNSRKKGTLLLGIEKAAKGWEVFRTDFLTDVSLRITRFDRDPMKEHSWRVTIHRDSWIVWSATG